MPSKELVQLAGSRRSLLPSSKLVGKCDPNDKLQVTVYVRRDPATAAPATSLATFDPRAKRLPAKEVLAQFSASKADIDAVKAYYTQQGLRVIAASLVKRSVLLEGTVDAVSKAFGVPLNIYDSDSGQYRGRSGAIYVPKALSGIVEAVFGLDNRRIGRSLLVRTRQSSVLNTYYPPDVASLYQFPSATDGGNQVIGVMAFNGEIAIGSGGYKPAFLQAYYQKVVGSTGPSIEDVVVHGPGNDPGTGQNPADVTTEIMLDLAMVGSLAAKSVVKVYFTVFTEQGWVDALVTAITDQKTPISVLSISYGNPEDEYGSGYAWTKAAVLKVNDTFAQAAQLGITICAASGDDGSTDQANDGLAHVDFPSSSPWVLAVGGTRLVSKNGVKQSESVWNDLPDLGATGGGVSAVFPLPDYQTTAGVPSSVNPGHRLGRGVPDVAAVADPETGYYIPSAVTKGAVDAGVGGTSAAAPLWAGLIARLNQLLGERIGFANPTLYGPKASAALNDITVGNNQAYKAQKGWDACTGLGTPNGTALASALKAPAGASKPARKKAAPVRKKTQQIAKRRAR